MQVKAEDQENLGRFAGTIQARYESNLGFRVPGRIARRLVDVGAEVEKGALLAVLDRAVGASRRAGQLLISRITLRARADCRIVDGEALLIVLGKGRSDSTFPCPCRKELRAPGGPWRAAC